MQKRNTYIFQFIFISCLFLMNSLNAMAQDCSVGLDPECPLTFEVCPGEEFKMTQTSVPPPPQSPPGGPGSPPPSIYDYYNFSYDIYQDGVKVCDNCHNKSFSVYTNTLYSVDYYFNGTSTIYYVLIEIKECDTTVDLQAEYMYPSSLYAEGDQSILVGFKNNGPGYLENTDIVFEVNGVVQNTHNYTGPSVAPENILNAEIATYYFETNTPYTIRAWTTAPNDSIDTNTANDTLTRVLQPIFAEYDLDLRSFTAPTLPIQTANDKPVVVHINNYSNAELNSYEIHWSVNGILQSPHTVTNPSPDPQDGQYYIEIGTYDFDVNEDYELKAWTVLPGNLIDQNPNNDTITLEYFADAYNYYLADRIYTACPNDTIKLTDNIFPDFDFSCHYCDFSASLQWIVNGVVVDEKFYDNISDYCLEVCTNTFIESFETTYTTNSLVTLQGTFFSDCVSVIGCNQGPIGPQPPLSSNINATFGIIMNGCDDGNVEPPVTGTPDCSKNTGTIYFENCNNQQYFLIEMEDGTIYDPYYGEGIEFDHNDGQKVNFDFVSAPFASSCTTVDQTIIITCIEEASPTNEISLFTNLPWINNIVDTDNCTGQSIEYYDKGGYAFVYINLGNGNAQMFLNDGTLYCTDGTNFSCREAYGLSNPDFTWECDDTITPPNPPVENDPLFDTYPWLNNIVDQNDCEGTTIEEFDLGSYAFILVTTATETTLYFEDGTFYCKDGINLDCATGYGLVTPTASWTCGQITPPEESGYCGYENITDLPWIQTLLDQEAFYSTINIHKYNGKTLFGFVSIAPDAGTFFYNCDGSLLCVLSGPLPPTGVSFCFDIVTSEVIETINIDDLIEENENEIFTSYSWLNDIVDQANCDGTTVSEYDLGPYAFVFIQTTESGTLYYEDGTPYCSNSENLDCLIAYGLTNPTETWACGGTTPNPPNPPSPTNELFEEYLWLNDLVNISDCDGTNVYEYDLGPYAFILITTDLNTILYFEDGTLYCKNSDVLDCATAYGLGTPTNSWTCGQDRPTKDEAELEELEDENNFANKIPVEMVPNWNIFPNPSSGSFSIELNGNADDIKSISIFNIQGQSIEERYVENTNEVIQFHLNNLETGIYFVNLQYGTKTVTKKLMIRN